MPTTYRIHPGVGIARLGNSTYDFCISPEQPAALPLACDKHGNPMLSADGDEVRITTFKDEAGRLKRQAARFQVWAYDDEHPEGRPLKLGDQIEGGGNAGTLMNIQWRVYLANKKASWYEFQQLNGEHGYGPNHARRNASITDPDARQRLIIDPGPRTVDHKTTRHATFDRDNEDYATTFPPPLKPNSIDTLGDLLTDETGRLLVLGGFGNSGSFRFDEFGQPRITDYANNDGWFDDTSDGPVMARLVMFSPLVQRIRYIDVEYPAWVVCAYPAYVPEILDVVTMEDVVEDMAIRKFAERTDLYGTSGTFNDPQHISPTDTPALIHWRAGRLQWNPNYKPWFYRDIWNILYRPDQYNYLCDVLGQSNFPHNQSTRGTFDYEKLSVPPVIDRDGVARCEKKCVRKHHSGELFVDELAIELAPLESISASAGGIDYGDQPRLLTGNRTDDLRAAVAKFAEGVLGKNAEYGIDDYLQRWLPGVTSAPEGTAKLKREVDEIIGADSSYPDDVTDLLSRRVHDHLQKYLNGQLLRECQSRCITTNTYDPYGPMRQYLFDLLRAPGEENQFMIVGRPDSRVHNLPRMPLLCGDNPITNELPSKFFRLTDYQYYLLRQWAMGLFYNEEVEKWAKPDPLHPYAGWVNRTGRDLDRGVVSNILGGSFCPGGEIGWVMRNPSAWLVPYRLKADRSFSDFGQTPAQANTGQVPDRNYAFYAGADLSQSNDFMTGLQPGDLTKYMSVPWQADFNECSTQPIDVTYERFNKIYPDSDNDELMEREQRVWETLWWPAHRPMQTFEQVVTPDGSKSISWLDWTPGVPQTNAGDLRMVTEWWRLPVVRTNPKGDFRPTTVPPPTSNPPYISVERTPRSPKAEDEL
ncbi:MAG TPA: LodA/GoxA family CTQ-dependent oxidase [Pyrinomonadaceae bacterium]|nr:LodA/GoxA family CTQ-dependent oxidase [Pyrinomonadaceae bacterium]